MSLRERMLRLTERQRIAQSSFWGDEGASPAPASLVPAAVLVAATERKEPGLLLTVRTAHLRNHAGQVAFPGGRIDSTDDGAIAAALREAEEEIGLRPDLVDVVGTGATYATGTGFGITPVFAIVPAELELVPHAEEVAAIFEPPLSHLFDPSHHMRRTAWLGNRERSYYEIMWKDYRIWGATAAMIVGFASHWSEQADA